MITFAKFERPARGGDGCAGADVLVDGKRVGYIARVLEWIDTGHVSVSYTRFRVTGYEVVMFADVDDEDGDEPEFKTLKEARDYVRTYVATKPTKEIAR